ncbi:hypothetical protein HPNQ4200_1588 [Helicobacter pylori NQ4200]|uniref:Lipoprotein n=1 Tax=Helicobacter pylori NQ4200 TaxID=992024 RepID=I9Q277_HELPX|nr:hypothetical protein HPNQ4200_1588 [Helicobacter pylori NQ4200]
MLVKVGLFLSFGAFACGYLKITARSVRDPCSLNKALIRFLKLSSTLIKQSLA